MFFHLRPPVSLLLPTEVAYCAECREESPKEDLHDIVQFVHLRRVTYMRNRLAGMDKQVLVLFCSRVRAYYRYGARIYPYGTFIFLCYGRTNLHVRTYTWA